MRLKEMKGEAVLDARTNAALVQLGQATVGLGGIGAPNLTLEQSFELAEYVCTLVKRAGLTEPFRALLINEAVEDQDIALCRLLGCPISGGVGAYDEARASLPGDVPEVRHAELAGRELVKRVVAREAARQGAEI